MSQTQPQEHPEVRIACRRGSDKMTTGQKCKGKKAFRLSAEGAPVAQFKCCTCNFSWDVSVGGTFVAPEASAPVQQTVHPAVEVHMACRRGSDRMTAGQKCDSKKAKKLSADGTPHAQYQCSKCGFGWSVALGGTFMG